MLIAAALLIGSAALIYIACGFFVNGVEWFGHRISVGETAVGTVLAAIGTALPESVVTLVAVAFHGGPAGDEIGVGAALGGPLVLSTIAYAVVGCCIFWFGAQRSTGTRLQFDGPGLARDQGLFLAIFAVKIGLGLVAFAYKPWLGWLFLIAYGLYVWFELRAGEPCADADTLEPLKLRPRQARPGMIWILVQTLSALVVIFLASHIFVNQLATIGTWCGLPPQLVALLLSPIATELPETLNAVIWVRQGKERLALSNISGSMMIQATVPSALGLLFTPWLFDRYLILAGALTALSIVILCVMLWRGRLNAWGLSLLGGLYLVFLAGVAWLH